MGNAYRGEISARIGGRERTLVLTLGALAELETNLGISDLNALAERLSQGRVAARDLIAIIGAGLRGAGEKLSNDEVGALEFENGIVGCAKITTALLEATFGLETDNQQTL